MKHIIGAVVISLVSSAVAFADCGEPPLGTPHVPNGTSSTTDDIRTARRAVLDYSTAVDAYLACMDQSDPKILPWLTKEQQGRREEDLVNLHNKRRDIQIKLNDAIREFRKKK